VPLAAVLTAAAGPIAVKLPAMEIN
jgi:hypothetical protein